jgi:hypothetical protein
MKSRNEQESNLKSHKSIKKPIFKFNYFWKASIPESWNRILAKNHMHQVNLNKKNRNTLEFLEETQKYINRICPPLKPDEIEIAPSSMKSSEQTKKLLKLLSSSREPGSKKLSPIAASVRLRRKKSLKILDSEFLIQNTRSCLKSYESPDLANN